MSEQRKLLTTKDACEYLGGISEDTLVDRRKRKEFAYYKLGGRYFYAVADLDAYIERCRVAAAPRPRVERQPVPVAQRKPGRPPNKPPTDSGYYPGMKVV